MAKREFTGVFIPAKIWESKELIPAEKMLLGEISALSERDGYCSASRQHFADWLHCTVQGVTYYFKKLEASGFLKIVRTQGERSKIYLNRERFYDTGKSDLPVSDTYQYQKVTLTGVVSPTYGGSKSHLPEIQVKDNTIYNNKNKEQESEKNAFLGEVEKSEVNHSFVEQKKEKIPPVAPAPPKKKTREWSDVLAELPTPVAHFIDGVTGRAGWFDYLDHRNEIKAKKYGSEKSEALAIKHLYELTNGDAGKIQAFVDQSRRNGWISLNPIKEERQGKQVQPIVYPTSYSAEQAF